jgi:hypothetical protein
MSKEGMPVLPLADRLHPFQGKSVGASSVKEFDLRLLGFDNQISPENITADDIRKHAISLRKKAQGDYGINTQTQTALRWALKETGNCIDDQEFNDFLLGGCDFNVILSRRFLKSATS